MKTLTGDSQSIASSGRTSKIVLRALVLVCALLAGVVVSNVVFVEFAEACNVSDCNPGGPDGPPDPPSRPDCDCGDGDNECKVPPDQKTDPEKGKSTSEGGDGSGGGGCACGGGQEGGPVLVYTGGESHTAEDLVVQGVYPIRMIRKYESQSRYDSPLGYGWGFTLDRRLYKYADGSIVVRNNCGTRSRFIASGGTYQAPEGLRYTLAATGSGYTLTKLKGARENYDQQGRLISQVDPQGNKLEMAYDPVGRLPLYGSSPFSITPSQTAIVAFDYHLTKVSERLADGTLTGNEVTLTYNGTTGRLEKIIASKSGDGREVTYSHDTSESSKNGNLLSVTGLEGLVSTYQYNDLTSGGLTEQDPHNLTHIQVAAGTTPYVNEYDAFDRVVKQTHGQHSLVFTYVTEGGRTDVVRTTRDLANQNVLNTLTTQYTFNSEGYVTQTHKTLSDGTSYRYKNERNSDARITKREVYEQPAGGSETLVRTIEHEYDGGNNVSISSAVLDSGEIITTTRIFDHQWLSSIKKESSLRPGEIFQTDYTFYYDGATGYPTNIKEVKRRNSDGNYLVSTFTYDTNGRSTQILLPNGHKLIKSYTGDKLTKRFHQVSGAESPYYNTQYAYDLAGNISQITNARSYSSSEVTDDLGRVIVFTNAKNEKLNLSYDPSYLGGSVLRQIETGSTTGNEGQITRFSYTPEGWLEMVERKKDNGSFLTVQTYTYDSAGNKLSSTDFLDGAPLMTSYSYDALDRLLAVTDPSQKITQYRYDALSNRTVIIDANLRETHYSYDDLRRVVKVEKDKTGLNATTAMSYDAKGNLLSVTDAQGSRTDFEYDTLSRRTKVTQPLGAPHELVTVYDDGDRVDYTINGRGQKADYIYEPWGGLKELRFFASAAASNPERTISYTYDHNGNMLGVTDDSIQSGELYSFTYDELDRMDVSTAKYLPGGNVTLNVDFDRFGNRSDLALDDGALQLISYGYNKLNFLTSVSFPGGQNPSLTYLEESGLTKEIQLASGSTISYLYHDNGPVKQVKVATSTAAVLEQLDYTYDNVLNTEMVDSVRDGGSHSFGYDNLDHLTSANHPGAQPDEQYSYDLVGNREDTSNLSAYDYNANHQLIQSPSNISYQYDNDGNLFSKLDGGTTETLIHDHRNRLVQYTNATVTADYQYDPFGRRISKTVNGYKTYYLWDETRLLAEYDNLGVQDRRYHYLPDKLTAVQIDDQGTIYDIHLDSLDVPFLVTDNSENVVWSRTMSVFGEMVPSGTVELNLRFPGQYYDSESGYHYNYFRNYAPAMGRYLQSDPIGLMGGMNTYAYVAQNPLKWVDPLGLESCLPLWSKKGPWTHYGRMKKELRGDVNGWTDFVGVQHCDFFFDILQKKKRTVQSRKLCIECEDCNPGDCSVKVKLGGSRTEEGGWDIIDSDKRSSIGTVNMRYGQPESVTCCAPWNSSICVTGPYDPRRVNSVGGPEGTTPTPW